jgi:hypothetical protein
VTILAAPEINPLGHGKGERAKTVNLFPIYNLRATSDHTEKNLPEGQRLSTRRQGLDAAPPSR